MPDFTNNDGFRANPNLKSSNYTEFIDQKEFKYRLNEIEKIMDDINYFAKNYFYIISLDKGKTLINPYPKQSELLDDFTKYKRVIVLASRQVGKSTSYSIYALWYVLINHDKNVLICANKQSTSVEILSKIKMAYEMLPMWLKPGIIEWNKTKVKFNNGCSISAEATSGSSGRRIIN